MDESSIGVGPARRPVASLGSGRVAAAPDDGRKLFLEQRLDRRTDVLPQPILDGVITGITAQ